MRPSLATNPAASSRACNTTLSLPEVEPDEAPVDADEPPAAEPAVVPAKLLARAGAARERNRRQVSNGRSMVGSAGYRVKAEARSAAQAGCKPNPPG